MNNVVQVLLLFIAIVLSVKATNPYSIAVDSANTVRQTDANTLDLAGKYDWATSVTRHINSQIQENKQAIAELKQAVDEALDNKNKATLAYDNATQKQKQAQVNKATAESARDEAKTNVENASKKLTMARSAYDKAQRELREAISNYEKKRGALTVAQNIRNIEVPFKKKEIIELQKILDIVGKQQSGSS